MQTEELNLTETIQELDLENHKLDWNVRYLRDLTSTKSAKLDAIQQLVNEVISNYLKAEKYNIPNQLYSAYSLAIQIKNIIKN